MNVSAKYLFWFRLSSPREGDGHFCQLIFRLAFKLGFRTLVRDTSDWLLRWQI